MQPNWSLATGLSLFAALSCGQPAALHTTSNADPSEIAQTLLANRPVANVAHATESTGTGAGTLDPEPTAPAQADQPVGTVRVVLGVSPSRRIPVQLWYPAEESARAAAAAGRSVLEFEPAGPEREQWARLVASATPHFTQKTMHAADAPPAAASKQRLPLVLISHCADCLRFGYFPVAERLAAHGFLVAAADHVDGTLYDAAKGTSVGLDVDDFLEQRRLDMFALTDAMLDPEASSIPQDLRARVDPERIGMLGHSFGALTTAYASTRDPRIRAIGILAMVASTDDRLPYTGAELAKRVMLQPLSKPAFYLAATEDIIQLFGMNDIIRSNFEHSPAAAWLATLKDAGHYSVTNLCGINDAYLNGCGPGQRVENLFERFTYLNLDLATDMTAQLVTTYFEQQLLGAARTSFAEIVSHHTSVLTVAQHTP